MTTAQQRQQSNRTQDGKYTTKKHSEAEADLGLNITQDYAQKQRDALARDIAVERQALHSKQRVLDLLQVHDLCDDLRSQGVYRVEVSQAPEYDYDAPGNFYVASEPEFLGGYQPTLEEEDNVITSIQDTEISFSTLAGADTSYAYGDDVATLDTTKDPGGVSRKDLEHKIDQLLDAGDGLYRIGGGLDPAKVTSNSNSKLFSIGVINSNTSLDVNHRMELILKQAEAWDRATANSTTRPTKYGNVPDRYNHLGELKNQ